MREETEQNSVSSVAVMSVMEFETEQNEKKSALHPSFSS